MRRHGWLVLGWVALVTTTTTAQEKPALPEGAVARYGVQRLRVTANIVDTAFTPDGRTLVVVCQEQDEKKPNVVLFDVATGLERKRLEIFKAHHVAVAAYKPLMVLDTSAGFEVWDLAADKRVQKWSYPQVVAVAREQNREVVLLRWDPRTGKALPSVHPPVLGVASVSFSADGSKFLAASAATLSGRDKKPPMTWGAFTVLDAKSGAKLADVVDIREAPARSVFTVLAPDGKTVARGVGAKKIEIFDLQTHKTVAALTSANERCAFTPDGKQLIILESGGGIVLWDIAADKEVRRFEGHSGGVQHLPPQLTQDGKLLAVSSDLQQGMSRVQLWDVATGKLVRYPTGHPDAVNGLAYSLDGSRLATISADTIVIVDPHSGAELRRWIAHKAAIDQIALSPDGKTLASTSGDAIELWDPATGMERRRLAAKGPLRSIAFTRDGELLIGVNGNDSMQSWTVENGAVLRERELPKKLSSPTLSPTGQHLVWLTDDPRRRTPDDRGPGSLLQWMSVRDAKLLSAIDLMEGQKPDRLRGGSGPLVHGFAFSPNGKLLASSGSDRSVRIWESVTQREIARFSNNPANTRLLAISPDGRLLAHGVGRRDALGQGEDETIVLRDLAAAQSVTLPATADYGLDPHMLMPFLRPLAGHQGKITCLAFSPDGKFLATGGADQLVMIWRVDHFFTRTDVPEVNATLDELWTRLEDPDARQAFQAIAQLAVTPQETLAFLGKHLRPVPRIDDKMIAPHIHKLGSENFAIRQRANAALEKFGVQGVHLMREAVKNPPSLEMKRRLELLLEKLDNPLGDAGQLRAYRALTLLVWIGTGESRQLLEELSQAAPAAWLTTEARDSLQRWRWKK
jgi:WD40 repeat protein